VGVEAKEGEQKQSKICQILLFGFHSIAKKVEG
jgi:hypothetical protein